MGEADRGLLVVSMQNTGVLKPEGKSEKAGVFFNIMFYHLKSDVSGGAAALQIHMDEVQSGANGDE